MCALHQPAQHQTAPQSSLLLSFQGSHQGPQQVRWAQTCLETTLCSPQFQEPWEPPQDAWQCLPAWRLNT